MSLTNVKADSGVSAHWIGVDMGAPEGDRTALQAYARCGNCGKQRQMNGTIVEKCPHCGDPERDVANDNKATNQNVEVSQVSPSGLGARDVR